MIKKLKPLFILLGAFALSYLLWFLGQVQPDPVEELPPPDVIIEILTPKDFQVQISSNGTTTPLTQTVLTAYKEIESGFESDLTSNQALEIINENIILSENIYNTTFDGFMKGSSSFEDTINANNALYDNLDLKARLEKVRIEQRINLILALGGGFNITND